MDRVISQKVNKAIENWKDSNFAEVVEFLKSCEYAELVEFGYLVEENDIDIKAVLEKSELENCQTSIDVIDALDGIKANNNYRVKASWGAMNDAETLILGVYLKRCDLSLDNFFDILNS